MTWDDLTAEEQELTALSSREAIMSGREREEYLDTIFGKWSDCSYRTYRKATVYAITQFLRRRRSNGRGEPTTETGNI